MMHICGQCHIIGNGCCFLRRNDEKFMFGLTFDEIVKIQIYSKFEQYQIVTTDNVEKNFSLEMQKFDEIFENTFVGNKRFKLRSAGGMCIFLTENGCKLPVNMRPFYCRLYPFWVVNDEVILIGAPFCEAMKYQKNLPLLMQKIETDSSQIKKDYYDYLEASRNHKKIMDNILDL